MILTILFKVIKGRMEREITKGQYLAIILVLYSYSLMLFLLQSLVCWPTVRDSLLVAR